MASSSLNQWREVPYDPSFSQTTRQFLEYLRENVGQINSQITQTTEIIGSSTSSSSGLIEPTVITGAVTGTVNGSNTVFSLPAAPSSGMLFLNGVFQRPGVDYTLAGAAVTMTAAPQGGATPDWLWFWGLA